MSSIQIKNRVETRVEKLKQSIVEHPYYERNSLRIVLTMTPPSVLLLLGDFPPIIRILAVLSLLIIAHTLYDHHREIQRWRDQT